MFSAIELQQLTLPPFRNGYVPREKVMQAILECIEQSHHPLTNQQLQHLSGGNTDQVSSCLAELRRLGKVRTIGKPKAFRYAKAVQ